MDVTWTISILDLNRSDAASYMQDKLTNLYIIKADNIINLISKPVSTQLV